MKEASPFHTGWKCRERAADRKQSSGKRTKRCGVNRTYLLYLRQELIALKPHYTVYRDGMNALYKIEGDLARRIFSIRKGGEEVLVLRRKLARILPTYTIERDGQVIAHIKKGLFRSLTGTVYDKRLEIRVAFESYNFDILVGGHKLCQVEQENASFHDNYDIRVFDGTMEEIAVALAVVCDHASDRADGTRYS